MTPERVGEVLRAARKQAGLSLLAVERVSAGEFRSEAVGAWERGSRNPTIPRVVALLAFYASMGSDVVLFFAGHEKTEAGNEPGE